MDFKDYKIWIKKKISEIKEIDLPKFYGEYNEKDVEKYILENNNDFYENYNCLKKYFKNLIVFKKREMFKTFVFLCKIGKLKSFYSIEVYNLSTLHILFKENGKLECLGLDLNGSKNFFFNEKTYLRCNELKKFVVLGITSKNVLSKKIKLLKAIMNLEKPIIVEINTNKALLDDNKIVFKSGNIFNGKNLKRYFNENEIYFFKKYKRKRMCEFKAVKTNYEKTFYFSLNKNHNFIKELNKTHKLTYFNKKLCYYVFKTKQIFDFYSDKVIEGSYYVIKDKLVKIEMTAKQEEIYLNKHGIDFVEHEQYILFLCNNKMYTFEKKEFINISNNIKNSNTEKIKKYILKNLKEIEEINLKNNLFLEL